MSKLKLRPEVQWFAENMERALRANDHKGGWLDCRVEWLIGRALSELCEAGDELAPRLARSEVRGYLAARFSEQFVAAVDKDTERAVAEIVDAANFLMMAADVLRSNT